MTTRRTTMPVAHARGDRFSLAKRILDLGVGFAFVRAALPDALLDVLDELLDVRLERRAGGDAEGRRGARRCCARRTSPASSASRGMRAGSSRCGRGPGRAGAPWRGSQGSTRAGSRRPPARATSSKTLRAVERPRIDEVEGAPVRARIAPEGHGRARHPVDGHEVQRPRPRPGSGSAMSGGEVTTSRMSRYGPSKRSTSPVRESPTMVAGRITAMGNAVHRAAHELLGAGLRLLHHAAERLPGLELVLAARGHVDRPRRAPSSETPGTRASRSSPPARSPPARRRRSPARPSSRRRPR